MVECSSQSSLFLLYHFRFSAAAAVVNHPELSVPTTARDGAERLRTLLLLAFCCTCYIAAAVLHSYMMRSRCIFPAYKPNIVVGVFRPGQGIIRASCIFDADAVVLSAALVLQQYYRWCCTSTVRLFRIVGVGAVHFSLMPPCTYRNGSNFDDDEVGTTKHARQKCSSNKHRKYLRSPKSGCLCC